MISYKYKLYNNKKWNKKLHELCRSSAFVWNHCLALQQRYYKLYGKYISSARMQSHFAKKVTPKYDFLKTMGSQSIQEIIQRLDTSYNRFFKKIQKRPPKFKSEYSFSSFVFKQAGYSLTDNKLYISKLKHTFKFFKSRDYGTPRNIRLKRDKLGDFYLIITSEEDVRNKSYGKTHDGASVGIDFGLKQYLTMSDGNVENAPLFFKRDKKKIASLSKQLSKKKRVKTGKQKYNKKFKKMVDVTMLGKNGEKARKNLCRGYRKIKNRRTDYRYKLAHQLCRAYDVIYLETLNLEGMKRLWGRKVSDLCHASFVSVLKEVSNKYGVVVYEIDQWYASSKTCNYCGHKNTNLTLKDRVFICTECGHEEDRDLNASKNILRQGFVEYPSSCKTTASAVADYV
jgi:putative transposase